MKLSKEEKLQKKVKNCYDNQAFYSKFEEAIESVQAWFITGGIIIGGVAIISGFVPAWLLFGSLVSIFAPIISLTFSRMMLQFYNDRGEYLKEKLYNLPTQETTSETRVTKVRANKNSKTIIHKQKTKTNKNNNELKDDSTLDR